MSHFHVIYQREQEDCGAACLAMITRFYGFHATMEAMKAYCGSAKNGMSLYGLNRAAERIGYSTQAVRLNKEELLALPAEAYPFIAHWKQNHFVVVTKATPHYIHMADPAMGKIRYVHKEFFDSFLSSDCSDGFALLLKPENIDTNLTAPKEKRELPLQKYIKPRWKQIAWAAFMLILLSGIGLVSPFLTKAIVDNGIAEKNVSLLVVILCATLSLAVGRTLFSFLQSRMTLIAGSLIDIDLANDLLRKLSALPMKFFSARKVGDMIQRVSDVSRVGDYFSSSLAESVLSFVMFCIYAGILLHLYPLLFGVFMCGSVLYVLFVLLFMRRRKILDYEFFNIASKSQEELIQFLRGMTELKLAGATDSRLGIWRNIRLDMLGVSRRSLMLSQKQELGSVFIFQVVDAVTVFFMAKAVIEGHTTLGSMMAVQYIIGSMESPLHIVTGFIRETQSMGIALSRINHIASAEPEREGGKTMDGNRTAPSIQINNVTFTYDFDSVRPALQRINANIPAGKTTALVGMSGSGKTTLIKLLLGFYTPDNGNIQIDGTSLSELDLSEWRKNIGSVLQDGYIFSDTIINNIALGDDTPSVERVKKALCVACADFVFELPIGLRTIIGAEGMSLSSGQRQRILLARAIYKQPAVFFLDEATNALDAINERKIYDNLHAELRGKTVVIAAHRLSTISNADQILVFDDGRIVESGTHTELIARNGEYAELVHNQRFNQKQTKNTYMMTEQNSISYFKENFPLVKIIDFDTKSKLFYDARANMVFVVDNNDMSVVAEYLQSHNKEALHSQFPNVPDVDGIIERIDSLQNKGVLLPGPADRLISTEPKDVQERIDYYMENILMRKYVLETTQQCNFRCRYCHNTLEPIFRHHTKKQMSFPVAKAAVDFYKELYLKFYRKLPEDKKALLLKHYQPFIGFYGGEPSLNWKLVENTVKYYLNLDWEADGISREKLSFSVNTNLYILTEEMMSFIMKYKPMLFISLDGPKEDNDRNRITIDGKGTFDRVFANINRIKSADPAYFKEKILLLCVEAEGNNTEAVHKLLDSFGCPVDYMNEQPYGCLERDPEGETQWYEEHEEEMIAKKLAEYKRRLAENDKDAMDEFTSLYFLDSIESDTPYMQKQLSVNLTCPLCVDNIMIDVDGGMHICHKTDGSLPLGNVCNGGYDMQKMFEAYKSYGATTNCKECRNCWAMNMCSYCAALRLDGGKWKNPRVSECDLQRRRVEYQLKLFVALYKLDPNFMPKLMERKHNLEHYKSIVDYNEFIKYVEK